MFRFLEKFDLLFCGRTHRSLNHLLSKASKFEPSVTAFLRVASLVMYAFVQGKKVVAYLLEV